MKAKHNADCEPEENLMMNHRQHQIDQASNLIESLEDQQRNIKDEEEMQREPLPEIDEFNEFSEPEDMMEDLRKEVEKVVETIADHDLPEATWSYQVSEIVENDAQTEDLQLYSNDLDSSYDGIDNSVDNAAIEQQNNEATNFESDDDEDEIPLEQVRQSLQKSTRGESEAKKFQVEDDREDRELTECLKKIHNFKCSIQTCNKAFNSRTALGYHLKTHTTERRFVCDQVIGDSKVKLNLC